MPRRARDTALAHALPLIIRSRASTRTDADGHPIHTVVVGANNKVAGHYDVDMATLDLTRFMNIQTGLWMHDIDSPILKTLEMRRGNERFLPGGVVEERGLSPEDAALAPADIEADFIFDPTEKNEVARLVESMWDAGVINAASFDWDIDPNDGTRYMKEWSIVSIPADTDAVRVNRIASLHARSVESLRSAQPSPQEVDVDPKELAAALKTAVTEALSESGTARSGDAPPALDADKLAATLVEGATTKAVEGLQEKLQAANDANERARAAADKEKRDREAELETVRTEERARSAVLVKAGQFLPDDFDASTATARSILEAALKPIIGDSVTEKSDGYLEATLDYELKARSAGGGQIQGHQGAQPPAGQRQGLPGLPDFGNGGQQEQVQHAGMQFARNSSLFGTGFGNVIVEVPDQGFAPPQIRSPELDKARNDRRDRRANAWQNVPGRPEAVAAPAGA